MKDQQYLSSQFKLAEKDHAYGPNVHLLDDPFHSSLLARFCEDSVKQPDCGRIAVTLSRFLVHQAINSLFPQKIREVQTRMVSQCAEARFDLWVLEDKPRAVVVDLMRAGILPSQTCYDILHDFLPASQIRQDHILLNRKTNDSEEVVGVNFSGFKIGGNVRDAFVFFADPMGATGSTIVSAVDLYRSQLPATHKMYLGKAKKYIALHFIVTPEYLRAVRHLSADLEIFALRLDRGLSKPEILDSRPGEHWDEEKGLNEKQYIVPGAGGIGEILNNSFV